MERNVHIGNKWWKKTTIYSKEMKTTINCVEDTEETVCSSEGTSMGEQEKEEQEIGKRRGWWEKKIQRQGGRCRRKDEEEEHRILLFTELFVTLCGQFCSWVNKAIIIIIVNEEAWEGVEEFRIGERADLDHLPLEINIEEPNYEERGKLRAKEEQKRMTIKIWDDQGVEE
jgi:hypothetical protein